MKTITIIVLSLIMVECTTQKRNCGSNRQHRQRSRSVKKFAPGWSYNNKSVGVVYSQI